MMLSENEIKEMFVKAGALKKGHFRLTSGLHSAQYVDKFKILSKPALAAPLLKEMAVPWKDKNIDIVVGPAIGGIILAYEIARQLGTEGIFLERKNGEMTFGRGFKIEPGQRVLVVEDVVTTGGSVTEVCEQVIKAGGVISGISLMVDRSGGNVSFESETHALMTLELEVYDENSCPLCREGVDLVAPGSTGKS